jgi:hypothetical protein
MPDLLIELFGEEIPARMQARGAEDLARLLTEALASLSRPNCWPKLRHAPKLSAAPA